MAPQKFIGGAERARRMAQSRGWEPPSQKKRRLEKEAEQKRKQRNHYRNKQHSTVVPLSTKKLRSSERFFAALLEASNFPNWKASVFPKDNNKYCAKPAVLETICGKLGLGPPPPTNQNNGRNSSRNKSFLPHTDNPRSFFSSRAILVMEEARYELEEALHKNLSRDKTNNGRSKSAGSWKEMKFLSLNLDEKRTGFLSVGLSKAKGRFSPEEVFQQRAGSCFELQVIMEGGNQTSKVSMLCSVAPGKPGSVSTKLMLVVYERNAIDRLLSLLQGSGEETHFPVGNAKLRWRLRFCVTLLSHCRQFEACDFASVNHRKGRSALLKEIMGQKKATHIRFCDSDNDGENNDNIEEGEEEIVSYITEETDGDFEEGENDNHDDDQSNEPQHSKLHLTMPCFTGLKSLNPTQRLAAEKFCSSDETKATLELIQGPPGTGKTTFVVSILARLLCQGREKGRRKRPRRILVTAPTNKAVGVIAKRFMESCPGLLDQYGMPVAMIGVQDKLLEPDEDGNVDEALKRIFCYTWLDTLAEEYEVLLEKLSEEKDNENDDTLSNPSENRGLSPWLSKTIPSVKNDTFMVGDDSDSDTEDEDEDRRAPQSDKSNIQPVSNVEKAKGLHLRLVRNLPWWSEASGAANLSRKLVGFLKDGDIAATCAYIEALAKILKGDKDNDDETDNDDDDEEGVRTADAIPELLASARIIFCTLSTAGTSLMKKTRRIDDWIVDEAAAATEPELLIPLHLDPHRLLVVGDPRQLPASVSSPLAEQWGLGRSLHERLADDLGLPQTMLDVQYRMKPEIAKFPSHQFYGGKLINGENVREAAYGSFFSSGGGRSDHWDLLQTTPPYSFFQIDSNEEQSHTGSYYNRAEASALVTLLKAVRGRFHLQGGKTNSLWCSSDKIRVITFYSAQVAVLRQILRKEGLHGVLVATVDSSQGCEADLVILSFVRTTRAGFLRDDRRMNVGLTRARHKLVCLGNFTKSAWAVGGSDNTKSTSSTLTNLLCDANTTRGCVSLALADQQKRT